MCSGTVSETWTWPQVRAMFSWLQCRAIAAGEARRPTCPTLELPFKCYQWKRTTGAQISPPVILIEIIERPPGWEMVLCPQISSFLGWPSAWQRGKHWLCPSDFSNRLRQVSCAKNGLVFALLLRQRRAVFPYLCSSWTVFCAEIGRCSFPGFFQQIFVFSAYIFIH